MINNKADKVQRLSEAVRIYGFNGSIADYATQEAQNDPDFFRWLFDNNDLNDFENPDKEEFNKFIEFCKC